MHQPPRRGEPEIDLEQILNRIRAALRSVFRGGAGAGAGAGAGRGGGKAVPYITFGILGLAFALGMATGIYAVGPGEKAANRIFGKCCNITEENAGLQWLWPAPIGTRNVESIRSVESMELGFSSVGGVSESALKQEK